MAETKEELEATEAARKALEEANQQLGDELAETKAQLDAMTDERNQVTMNNIRMKILPNCAKSKYCTDKRYTSTLIHFQLDLLYLQLQTTLDATSAALAECTEAKMTCESNLTQMTANAEQLTKQLGEAMMMLKAEKEAREQLTATILLVQEQSIKVQQEIKKLQVENIMLQKQVEKLQSEQRKYY